MKFYLKSPFSQSLEPKDLFIKLFLHHNDSFFMFENLMNFWGITIASKCWKLKTNEIFFHETNLCFYFFSDLNVLWDLFLVEFNRSYWDRQSGQDLNPECPELLPFNHKEK